MKRVTAQMDRFVPPCAMGEVEDAEDTISLRHASSSTVVPGIDDQIIAKEEQTERITSVIPLLRAVRQAKARELANQPDVCRRVNGQLCHLGVHRTGGFNTKQIDTRGRISCSCIDCD